MATKTKAPERIWIQQDSEGCRPRWSTEPIIRRAGLAHVNIPYDRADAAPREQELRDALEKIRDGDIECNCDHSNEFCCTNVDEYCAFCIAAVALATEEVK